MPIEATIPTIVPGRDEVTYPHWYVVGLTLNGRDRHPDEPRQMVNAIATLAKCRVLEDGSTEFAPSGETVTVSVSDVLGLAAEDSDVAEWLARSIALIVAKATEQEVL